MTYAVVTYFVIAGFLLGWLATRLFLSKLMDDADRRSLEKKVSEVQEDVAKLFALSISPTTLNILRRLDQSDFKGPFDLWHDNGLGIDLEHLYQKGYIRFEQADGVHDLKEGKNLDYDLCAYVKVTPLGKSFLKIHASMKSQGDPQ